MPHTLKGKFVDKETGRDLTAYMDMQPYGELRALKMSRLLMVPGNMANREMNMTGTDSKLMSALITKYRFCGKH